MNSFNQGRLEKASPVLQALVLMPDFQAKNSNNNSIFKGFLQADSPAMLRLCRQE
jgi:hypothetical protein